MNTSLSLSREKPLDSHEFIIGVLIPTTSINKQWKSIEQTDLYNIFLPQFMNICCDKFKYVVYIGFDHNDTIFTNNKKLHELAKNINKDINITLKFIQFESNIAKGHLTKMWNILFKKAYDDNCDYFFQCGDDIKFFDKGLMSKCVETLQFNNNIGVVGPVDLRHAGHVNGLLSQSFVSRKHMEIFGFYFPEELLNWYCDDWIGDIYYPKYKTRLIDFKINNEVGARYNISNTRDIYIGLVKRDKNVFENYLNLE